jgi:hypothetical protein
LAGVRASLARVTAPGLIIEAVTAVQPRPSSGLLHWRQEICGNLPDAGRARLRAPLQHPEAASCARALARSSPSKRQDRPAEIRRRDQLGGLIREYYRAARNRDTKNGALHEQGRCRNPVVTPRQTRDAFRDRPINGFPSTKPTSPRSSVDRAAGPATGWHLRPFGGVLAPSVGCGCLWSWQLVARFGSLAGVVEAVALEVAGLPPQES